MTNIDMKPVRANKWFKKRVYAECMKLDYEDVFPQDIAEIMIADKGFNNVCFHDMRIIVREMYSSIGCRDIEEQTNEEFELADAMLYQEWIKD